MSIRWSNDSDKLSSDTLLAVSYVEYEVVDKQERIYDETMIFEVHYTIDGYILRLANEEQVKKRISSHINEGSIVDFNLFNRSHSNRDRIRFLDASTAREFYPEDVDSVDTYDIITEMIIEKIVGIKRLAQGEEYE